LWSMVMVENQMVIPTTRWSGNPNDPNAPEETRPAGCECRRVDEAGHNDPASEHDPSSEKCPLYYCAECGHWAHEGECPVERGDGYIGDVLQALGPCTCGMTLECGGCVTTEAAR